MLLKEENTQQLDKYLIESSAIYSEIVEPKIDTLVSNTDVTLIYNVSVNIGISPLLLN